MRAKLPSESGFIDRDGVRIYYEIYGDGPETMLFVPPCPVLGLDDPGIRIEPDFLDQPLFH